MKMAYRLLDYSSGDEVILHRLHSHSIADWTTRGVGVAPCLPATSTVLTLKAPQVAESSPFLNNVARHKAYQVPGT